MFELKSLLILLFLISIETMILILFFFSVLLHRIYALFASRLIPKQRNAITDQILFLLENPDAFTPQRAFSHTDLLVTALETFNDRLKGDEWQKVKEKIVSYYLLAKARRSARSWFWKKRSFAARTFALLPLAEDEPLILQLLSDRVFLVQGAASLAAIKLESKKGTELTLQQMSKKTQNYTRYYYRDILLNGSPKIFQYLVEIALEQKNPDLKLAVLEIMSGKTVPVPLPFLKEDLASGDPRILSTALHVLTRNSIEHAEEIFLKATVHSASIVRTAAAIGLKQFPQANVLQTLAIMLKDQDWEVRLQAATSLSQMGPEGIEILKHQDPKRDRNAAEIAHYALDFLV